MTISSIVVKNSYSGNGSTRTFTYTFRIFQDSDLVVLIRDINGDETVKTLNTHYTVTGAGNLSGGSVIFTTGNTPLSTETVVLRRELPQTQSIDYIANDPFPAESHEEGLDRAMMAIQQLQEEVTRSIKLSRTNTMDDTEFYVGAELRAGKLVGFDGNGELTITSNVGSYKGNWTSGTIYLERDLVKDPTNGNIYIVKLEHVASGTAPLSSNVNSSKYTLIIDAVTISGYATAAAASATSAANSAITASGYVSTVQASATSAANSATTASGYLSTVQTNATNAASSATSASTSAATATTKASEASTSATNAATSASSALSSKNAAATSATAAQTAQTAVETVFDNFDDRFLGSKTSDPTVDNDGNALLAGTIYYNSTAGQVRFYNGATWDAPSASAATSATNASTSASNAASSATSASNSASTATTQAYNASTSASSASTSATNAASSATSASTSASTATTQASTATTQAGIATTQAGIATTKASEASTSATNAASSASSASTSATTATTQASNASTSASNASTSATNASTSATNAASSLTNLNAKYLGSKSTAPTLDNNGNALVSGALYYNTTNSQLYVYTGSAWNAAAFSASGSVTSFNTRTGSITLSGSDVTTALGITPISSSSTDTLTNKSISGSANTITNLNASNLSSGTVPSARLSLSSTDIPSLDASKITTGTIGSARLSLTATDIPSLDASKITTGTIGSSRLSLTATDIPSLDASKITTGTIASSRLSLTSSDLPTVPTTKGGTGLTTIGTSNQYLKVNSAGTGLEYGAISTPDLSNLNASNLTSGTIPSARLSLSYSDLPTVPVSKGGTGLTSLGSAGQSLVVNSAGTGLEFKTGSSGVGDGLINNFTYTATAGQTVFTGSDNNSATFSFTETGNVFVFVNGVRITPTSDYTLSGTNTLTLSEAAKVGDVIYIEVIQKISLTEETTLQGYVATALSYKNTATSQASTATTQAGIATTQASNASSSASAALASQNAAATSESTTLGYKNTTLGYKNDAESSATAAAASAAQATAGGGVFKISSTDSQADVFNTKIIIGNGLKKDITTTSGFQTLTLSLPFTETTINPTDGQTTINVNYTPGYIQVFVNGVKLVKAVDFTATNGTSIVLSSGLLSTDIVDIVNYS